MGSVAIVTDSNTGMSFADAEKLGLYMIPMTFYMDGTEYREDIDMSQDDFFRRLADKPDTKVSTSQPAAGVVTDLWDSLLKNYDEIVHVPMSSGLSGACQTARILAEDYDGRVCVADNQRISGTLRYSCIEALQLAKKGRRAAEIAEWLEETKFDSSIYITVQTLKYLKQGGRITPAAAAIGTLLKIKPVLQIQGEKLDAFAKARTMTQAKTIMLQAARDDLERRFGGKMHVDIIYSSDRTPSLEWMKELEDILPHEGEFGNFPLSLSVSCHIGGGSLALTCSKVHDEIWV